MVSELYEAFFRALFSIDMYYMTGQVMLYMLFFVIGTLFGYFVLQVIVDEARRKMAGLE